MNRLVELRQSEGYLAECQKTDDGKGWYINEFHCSIRTIAEAFPIVCDQELDLIRSIFTDCHVERIKWRIESGHSCGFQILPLEIHV